MTKEKSMPEASCRQGYWALLLFLLAPAILAASPPKILAPGTTTVREVLALPTSRGTVEAGFGGAIGQEIRLPTAGSSSAVVSQERVSEEEEGPRPIPPFTRSLVVGKPLPPIVSPETVPPPAKPRETDSSTAASPTDLVLTRNTSLLSVPSSQRSNWAPEPSLGVNDPIAFSTGNWYAALSTDSGRNFAYVNPYTAFPAANAGFCCDQVALYVPSRDLLVWVLQYSADANGSTTRLAVAKGQANQASLHFTYYDLTPQGAGTAYPAGYWFDFPDLSYSANSLYLTTNTYTPGNTGTFVSSVIFRFSLDQLAAGGSINWQFFTFTDSGSSKAVQGAQTTMYFGTHPSSTNSVRLMRLPEGSNTLTFADTPVSPYINGNGSCPDPGGVNACGFADHRMGAAWRWPVGGGQIGLMWNAAQGDSFPMPYVQVAIIRESDGALVGQSTIWSTTVAWQYPSAGVNARGDVAGLITVAGGALYAGTNLWVSDDLNNHSVGPIENYWAVAGNTSPSKSRWGDYFTTRQHSIQQNLWVTVATADTVAANGVEPHFMIFGRRRDTTSGGSGLCSVDANTLCLSASRFKVTANWQTATSSGVGTGITLTPDTGYFWFFNSSNVEMVVKVLDACGLNSKKWVFSGGLTNVNVVITVTDTQTGLSKTYTNPQNTAFLPIQDTNAFSTCP